MGFIDTPAMAPWLRELCFTLTGDYPPSGHGSALVAYADALERVAAGLRNQVVPATARAVGLARAGFSGKGGKRFADLVGPFATEEPRHLPAAADQLDELARTLRTYASKMEYTKRIVLEELVEIAASFAIAYYMAAFTGGGSLAALAEEIAILRFLMQFVVVRLAVEFALAAAIGIPLQLIFDVVSQVAGFLMETQDGWLIEESSMAVVVGLAGAALAPVLGRIAHPVTAWLQRNVGARVGGHDMAAAVSSTMAEFAEKFEGKPVDRATLAAFAARLDGKTGGALSREWDRQLPDRMVDFFERHVGRTVEGHDVAAAVRTAMAEFGERLRVRPAEPAVVQAFAARLDELTKGALSRAWARGSHQTSIVIGVESVLGGFHEFLTEAMVNLFYGQFPWNPRALSAGAASEGAGAYGGERGRRARDLRLANLPTPRPIASPPPGSAPADPAAEPDEIGLLDAAAPTAADTDSISETSSDFGSDSLFSDTASTNTELTDHAELTADQPEITVKLDLGAAPDTGPGDPAAGRPRPGTPPTVPSGVPPTDVRPTTVPPAGARSGASGVDSGHGAPKATPDGSGPSRPEVRATSTTPPAPMGHPRPGAGEGRPAPGGADANDWGSNNPYRAKVLGESEVRSTANPSTTTPADAQSPTSSATQPPAQSSTPHHPAVAPPSSNMDGWGPTAVPPAGLPETTAPASPDRVQPDAAPAGGPARTPPAAPPLNTQTATPDSATSPADRARPTHADPTTSTPTGPARPAATEPETLTASTPTSPASVQSSESDLDSRQGTSPTTPDGSSQSSPSSPEARAAASLAAIPTKLDVPLLPRPEPATGTPRTTQQPGGALHAWLDVPPSDAVAAGVDAQLRQRLGEHDAARMVVVHGHGRNLRLLADQLGPVLAAAAAGGAGQALLLACGQPTPQAQEEIHDLVRAHGLVPWSYHGPVWVHPATGAVFLGPATVDSTRRLHPQQEAGRLGSHPRRQPGHATTPTPATTPLASLTANDAAKLLGMEERGKGKKPAGLTEFTAEELDAIYKMDLALAIQASLAEVPESYDREQFERRMREMHITVFEIDEDGDCFYRSIIRLFGRAGQTEYLVRHVFGGRRPADEEQAIVWLREWMADRLALDFAVADRGLPSRYGAAFPYDLALSPEEQQRRLQQGLPIRSVQEQQKDWLYTVRDPDRQRLWNSYIGDVLGEVAARELGVPMLLVQHDYIHPLGPPGVPDLQRAIVMVRTPNHYRAGWWNDGRQTLDTWDQYTPLPESSVAEAELTRSMYENVTGHHFDNVTQALDALIADLPEDEQLQFTERRSALEGERRAELEGDGRPEQAAPFQTQQRMDALRQVNIRLEGLRFDAHVAGTRGRYEAALAGVSTALPGIPQEQRQTLQRQADRLAAWRAQVTDEGYDDNRPEPARGERRRRLVDQITQDLELQAGATEAVARAAAALPQVPQEQHADAQTRLNDLMNDLIAQRADALDSAYPPDAPVPAPIEPLPSGVDQIIGDLERLATALAASALPPMTQPPQRPSLPSLPPHPATSLDKPPPKPSRRRAPSPSPGRSPGLSPLSKPSPKASPGVTPSPAPKPSPFLTPTKPSPFLTPLASPGPTPSPGLTPSGEPPREPSPKPPPASVLEPLSPGPELPSVPSPQPAPAPEEAVGPPPPPEPELPKVRPETTRVREADTEARRFVFAPPEYMITPDLGHGSGPHTTEQADDRLVAKVKELALERVPEGKVRDEISEWLDERLTKKRFNRDSEQVIGDVLTLFVPTSKGLYEITVKLHLGDWEQITDPHGNLLDPEKHRGARWVSEYLDPRSGQPEQKHTLLPGKSETRTRQQHDASVGIGERRAYGTNASLSAGVNVTQGWSEGAVTSATGQGTSAAQLVNKTTARETSEGATTTASFKGSSYRSVDFLTDAGVIVTARLLKPGEPIRVGTDVVNGALIQRYHREDLERHPRPADVAAGATSATWAALTGKRVARTADITNMHDEIRAGRLEWPPRHVDDGDPAPAGDIELSVLPPPRPEPTRTTWVDDIRGVDRLRRAAFAAAKPSLVRPGTQSYQDLTDFVTIAMLKGGGLEQMTKGGLPFVLAERVGQKIEYDLLWFTAELRPHRVRREQEDWSRVDIDDALVPGTASKTTVGDTLNLAGMVAFALGRMGLAWAYRFLPGLRRDFSYTTPGQNVGFVESHKLKFTREPQSQIYYDVHFAVRSVSTGEPAKRVTGQALYRQLWTDAVNDNALRDRFKDHPPGRANDLPWGELTRTEGAAGKPAEQEEGGNPADQAEREQTEQTRIRTHPDRMLLMPAEFEEWLPPLSRVNKWGEEVDDVLYNAIELIRREFPDYLPGISLADTSSGTQPGSRVQFGPGWEAGIGNFVKLWNAVNPLELARRVHRMAYGGQPDDNGVEVVLPYPGRRHPTGSDHLTDEQLTLRFVASYDRREFRYKQTLGGQMETYQGSYYDLVTSAARTWQATLDPLTSVLSPKIKKLLGGVDVTVSPIQESWKATATDSSGVTISGATGGGSDWLSQFEGSFTFRIAAEKWRQQKAPMPGAYPEEDLSDLEAGRTRVTIQQAEADPFHVRADLLVTEDLTEEVVPPDDETRTKAEIPTSEFYAMRSRSTLHPLVEGMSWHDQTDPSQPLTWSPTPESPYLQQNAVHLPNKGPLERAVRAAFRAVGITAFDPAEHHRLSTAIDAAGPKIRDYHRFDEPGRPDPRAARVLSRGRLKWGPWRDTWYELRLAVRVDRIAAKGPTNHGFTYRHANASRKLADRYTTDHWAYSAAANYSLPWSWADGMHTINWPAVAGLKYAREHPRSHEASRQGTGDRAAIDIGPQFWFVMDGRWEVMLRIWNENDRGAEPADEPAASAEPTGEPAESAEPAEEPAASAEPREPTAPGKKGGGAHYLYWLPQASTRVERPFSGLGIMRMQDAREFGLFTVPDDTDMEDLRLTQPAPESSEFWQVAREATRGGLPELPVGPEELPAGYRLPPSDVLLGNSLSYSMTIRSPDLAHAYDEMVKSLRRLRGQYGPTLVHQIEGQLEAITSIIGAEAVMGLMLEGFGFLVPWRGWLTTSIAVLEFQGRLAYSGYLGRNPSRLQVLEITKGSVREDVTGHRTKGTWTATGSLPSYTLTLSPPKIGPDRDHLDRDFFRGADAGVKLEVSSGRGREMTRLSGDVTRFAMLNLLRSENFALHLELSAAATLDKGPIAPLDLFLRPLERLLGPLLRPLIHTSRTDMLAEGHLANAVVLGFPRQLTRIDPRAVAEVAGDEPEASDPLVRALIRNALRAVAARLDPAHPQRPEPIIEESRGAADEPWRTGLKLSSDMLAEAFLEKPGGTAALREAAGRLVRGASSAATPPARSWLTSPRWWKQRIDTVLSDDFIGDHLPEMLLDEFPMKLTVPGKLWDSHETMYIGMDVQELQLSYVDSDGRTVDEVLLKDLERHYHSVRIDQFASTKLSGSAAFTPKWTMLAPRLEAKPSDKPEDGGALKVNADDLDTVAVPISVTASAEATSQSTPHSVKPQLEEGDKTSGRHYTRIRMPMVRWRLRYRDRIMFVMVFDGQTVLWVPTQRAPDLFLAARHDGAPPPRPPLEFLPADQRPRFDRAELVDFITRLPDYFRRHTALGVARRDYEQAVLDAFEAGQAAEVEGLEPGLHELVSARDRLQAAADGLAALAAYEDPHRLSDVSDLRLLELQERLEGLARAIERLNRAAEAGYDLLNGTPAPEPMRQRTAELRTSLEQLNERNAERIEQEAAWRQALDGVAAAGIDLDAGAAADAPPAPGTGRQLEALQQASADLEGRTGDALTATEDVAGLNVFTGHVNNSWLDSGVRALTDLHAALDDHRQQLDTLLTPHAQQLRDSIRRHDAAIASARWTARASRDGRTWLLEWAAAAAPDLRDQLQRAVDAVEQARRRAEPAPGDPPIGRMSPYRLAQVNQLNRALTEALAVYAVARAEVRRRLAADHADSRPPTVAEARPLRRELLGLWRRVGEHTSRRAQFEERAAEARRWLDIADDAGADVSGLQARLGDAAARLADADADALRPAPDANPYTYSLREVRAHHDSASSRVAAAEAWEQAVTDVEHALRSMPAPATLVRQVLERRAGLDDLESPPGPDDPPRRLPAVLDHLERAGTDVRQLRQELANAHRATLRTPRPGHRARHADPTRSTLQAASRDAESLQAAVEAGTRHRDELRRMLTEAERLPGADTVPELVPAPPTLPTRRITDYTYTYSPALSGAADPPFRRHPELRVESGEPAATFPADRPAQAPILDDHPPLQVSGDGTLAVNAEGGGQEFYAAFDSRTGRSDIVDRANAVLRQQHRDVTFVTQPAHQIEVEVHIGHRVTRRLTRVVPVFSAGRPPADDCRSFASAVLRDAPGVVVFRPADPGGDTALSAINVDDGLEVTGMHYLARAMLAAVDGTTGLADVTPQWAADAVAADRRAVGDLDRSTVLPGAEFGRAQGLAPENADRRERMDRAAEIGVQGDAYARVGEAYLTNAIFAAGPGGTAVLENYAREGEIDPGAWGYDFAAVVAESEDGQTQVTLENYARIGERERAMREAIDLTLDRHRGGFHALRDELVRRAGPTVDTDPRVKLVDALIELERLRTEGADPAAEAAPLRAAADAMAAVLSGVLPEADQVWQVGMYGRRPGETFHESRARLRAEDPPPMLANPLTVVVLSRRHRAVTTEILFDPGVNTIAELDAAERNRVVDEAWRIVEQGSWARSNRFDLPRVVITGHGDAGRAQRRAEAVAQELRDQVRTILDGLGAARPEFTAEDIEMRVEAALAPPAPAAPREAVDISVTPAIMRPAVAPALRPDRTAIGNYRAALGRVMDDHPLLRIDDAAVQERIDSLIVVAERGRLENDTDLALGRDMRRRLAAVAGRLGGLPPDRRALLVDAIHDLLLSTALVASREAGPGSGLGGATGRQALQVLPADELATVLTGIADDLGRKRDPFDHTLADIDYQRGEPLVQRLGRLSVLHFEPAARRELLNDPMFQQLLASPLLLENMLFLGGTERRRFLNTGSTAAVDAYLLTRSPTIPGLLLVGNRLATAVETVANSDLPVLKEFDRPGRTVQDLLLHRVHQAQQQFRAISLDFQTMLDADPAPQAADAQRRLADLLDRWGETMQKLSAVLAPGPDVAGVPKLTRPVIPLAPGLSLGLAVALTDRRARRRLPAPAQAYLDEVARYFLAPLPRLTDLTAALRAAGGPMQYWVELRAADGVLVGPDDRMVLMRAVMRGDGRAFEIVDPRVPDPQYVLVRDLAAWAADWLPARPIVGGPLVASRVPADPSASPWSPEELTSRARLVGDGPGGRSLWFESRDPAWGPGGARPVVLGTPAAGEVRVHLEGSDGEAYLDRRPVPADVLADALVERLKATRWAGLTRVVLLIPGAGRGEYVTQLRLALAALGHPNVGVVAAEEDVLVRPATGDAVAVTTATSAGTLTVTGASQFVETTDDGAQPVGRTWPPGADLRVGPFTQRLAVPSGAVGADPARRGPPPPPPGPASGSGRPGPSEGAAPGSGTTAPPGEQESAGTASAPRLLGGDLVPSSVEILKGAQQWTYAELLPAVERAGPDERSLVFVSSRNPKLTVRHRQEAELSRSAAGEVRVHAEGRDGKVYHDGREVPPVVLAEVVHARFDNVQFDRVTLLVCHAGQGNGPVSIIRALAARGRPNMRVRATPDVAAVSATTGTAVAVKVTYDAAGVPQPTGFGEFREWGGRALPSPETSVPKGSTVPEQPEIPVDQDSGPFAMRMADRDAGPPEPPAPGEASGSGPKSGRPRKGKGKGRALQQDVVGSGSEAGEGSRAAPVAMERSSTRGSVASSASASTSRSQSTTRAAAAPAAQTQPGSASTPPEVGVAAAVVRPGGREVAAVQRVDQPMVAHPVYAVLDAVDGMSPAEAVLRWLGGHRGDLLVGYVRPPAAWQVGPGQIVVEFPEGSGRRVPGGQGEPAGRRAVISVASSYDPLEVPEGFARGIPLVSVAARRGPPSPPPPGPASGQPGPSQGAQPAPPGRPARPTAPAAPGARATEPPGEQFLPGRRGPVPLAEGEKPPLIGLTAGQARRQPEPFQQRLRSDDDATISPPPADLPEVAVAGDVPDLTRALAEAMGTPLPRARPLLESSASGPDVAAALAEAMDTPLVLPAHPPPLRWPGGREVTRGVYAVGDWANPAMIGVVLEDVGSGVWWLRDAGLTPERDPVEDPDTAATAHLVRLLSGEPGTTTLVVGAPGQWMTEPAWAELGRLARARVESGDRVRLVVPVPDGERLAGAERLAGEFGDRASVHIVTPGGFVASRVSPVDVTSTAADPAIRNGLRPEQRRALEGQRPWYRLGAEDLFRLDGRSPDVVRREGLRPRREAAASGNPMDVYDHVELAAHDNAFVSLTRDPAFPHRHRTWIGPNYRYFYRIDGTRARGGIDANATLQHGWYGPGQEEVLFPGGVADALIAEVWEVGFDQRGAVTMRQLPWNADDSPPPPPPAPVAVAVSTTTSGPAAAPPPTPTALPANVRALTQVAFGPEGRVLVQIRAADDPAAEAPVNWSVVPPGHVAIDMHGRGGTALVSAATVQAVLEALGVADRPRLLLVCEALAGANPFAEQMAGLAPGVVHIATEDPVWVDARTGTALAAVAALDRAGRLRIARLGRFRSVVVPRGGGAPQRSDLYPTMPAGNRIELEGEWSERGTVTSREDPTWRRATAAVGRRVDRLASAAYRRLELPGGGTWLRPRELADVDQPFADAVAGWPAPAPGQRRPVVIGVPGRRLPDYVVDQVREWLHDVGPEQAAATRLVFAGQPTPEQVGWARRRAARGVEVVYPLGEILADPGGTLGSGAGWQLITPDPGHPTGRREEALGQVYPPAPAPSPPAPSPPAPPEQPETRDASPGRAGEDYGSAEELLGDLLRAAKIPDVRQVPADGSLGVDMFGLLEPPPPPAFLLDEHGNPYDYSGLNGDGKVHLLRLLDMRRHDPDAAEMDPATWSVEPGRSYRHVRDSPHWAPAADAPPLPLEIDVPKVVPAIWFGVPPGVTERPANFADTFGDAADRLGDEADFVLVTDVPRHKIAAVRGLPVAPADPGLAAVWGLLDWTERTGVRLVNAIELRAAVGSMEMFAEFATEMLKQTGPGYAAASDLQRVDFMIWVGGLYSDGDNPIDDLNALAEVAESDAAFALQVISGGSVIVNAAYVAPPGHPFFLRLRDEYKLVYSRPQPDLYGPAIQEMPTESFLTGFNRARRYSIIARTTSALEATLSAFGYVRTLGRYRTVPRITGIGVGEAESWKQVDPPLPTTMSREETLRFTQGVVHTLIRSLYNRNGDLRLTEAADAIRRHPRPELIWAAAIGFLASREDLREKVRSLTRIRLRADGGRDEVDLPAAVLALFRWVDEELEFTNAEGHWLAEQPEPARLLANPERGSTLPG